LNFEIFFENNEISFVNLSDIEIYKLSCFELSCDLATLQEKGWYKIPYGERTIASIKNDLAIKFRPVTAGILTTYINAHGKEALEEIKRISYVASNFVSSYKSKCFNRTDENLFLSEKSLDNLVNYYTKPFSVQYKDVMNTRRMVYSIESVEKLFIFDFYKAIENYRTGCNIVKVKRCQNCGRYFIVTGRSDTVYCDYPSPQNPKYNCNDKQMVKFYGVTDLQVEIKKRRHLLYTTWQTNVRRHPDDENARYFFEHFKKRDGEYKEGLRIGCRTESEYYDFLRTCQTPKQYKDNPEQYADAINGTEEE
jgi:hypothetical protein